MQKPRYQSILNLMVSFFLLLAVSLACTPNTQTETATPEIAVQNTSEGGGILTLVIDPSMPSTLYAATMKSGIFKSTDGGQTWTATSNDLTNTNIWSIALDPVTPNILYVGAHDCPGTKGVFKSTNGGANWTPANTGLDTMINDIALDPLAPGTLYTATGSGGIFKSTDSGGSWNQINTGLNTDWINDLAIDPVTTTTLYAVGGNNGVFKSVDGGGSWRAINTGLTDLVVYTLAIDPKSPMTLYTGTYQGAFKSTDGGENWYPINQGLVGSGVSQPLVVDVLVLDPLTPSTLYAGTRSAGVFKSTDGGENWHMVTKLPEQDSEYAAMLIIDSLAIDPSTPTTLYAGTWGSGVLKSTDAGETWYTFNTGLPDIEVLPWQ